MSSRLPVFFGYGPEVGGSENTTPCRLCRQFINDVNLAKLDDYKYDPGRWSLGNPSTGPGFQHHTSLGDLSASSQKCPMCLVLLSALHSVPGIENFIPQERLHLFPWQKSHLQLTPSIPGKGITIALSFASEIHPGSSDWSKESQQTFPRFVNIYHADGLHQPIRTRGSDSPEAFQKMRDWSRDCLLNHPNCQRMPPDAKTLPARFIDVGLIDGDTVTLQTPSLEFGATPYTALSHCWGGDIPGKTVKENVEARQFGIPNKDIALTFRDAIRITRELGIRYLWIDALCIIQNSPEEWARESVKMMSLYAGATVTISALEARSSSAGILKKQLIPFAILSGDYVAQKNLRPFPESIGECPLDSRAWCMQERLLAPAILHFGEEQMFWECRTHQAYEDGRVDPEGTWYYGSVSSFMKLRRSINIQTTGEWGTWYDIIEDYSRRDLTVGSDKLPAIAGAAQAFREAQPSGTDCTYVAGLWKQDIRRGIAWGAHYHHAANRKVGGYANDSCAVLTKPRQQRAPSWSWASVDGQVAFRWRGAHDLKLNVRMTRGENNLMEASPAGTLELWGTVAPVLYYPPPEKSYDVGCLAFGSDPDPSDQTKTLPGCVLDIHRDQPRPCWAVNIGTHSDQLWLVLHLREDGLFERIGLCTGHCFGQSFVSDDTFVERMVSIV